MKNMVLVLIILLLVSGAALFSDPPTQTLTDLKLAIANIDMTANAEILIFEDNTTLSIYSNNGSQFLFKSEFEGQGRADGLDITADGEWILHVSRSAFFYILRYNHTINDYSLFQQLQIEGGDNGDGAITDDHQWLVLTKEDGRVYIYIFNETEFIYKETLDDQLENIIKSVTITNDHMFLCFSVAEYNVYVYSYNGSNFTLYQNITMEYENVGLRNVFMTDDGQYISLSGKGDKFMRIYQRTGSGFIEIANQTYNSEVIFASFSKDKTYLAVTAQFSKTYIYKNPISGNLTSVLEVSGRYTHLFSDNNKYLVTGLRQKVNIYLNSEFEECSILYCMECQNSTCLKCNELQDYLLNPSTGSCDFCSIENCVRCATLERCMECDEVNGYLVSNRTGLCELCGIDHCLSCTNSSCTTCDEANGYLLTQTGLCWACGIENCLSCVDSTCTSCHKDNNYFLNASEQCQLCSLENCLKCQSLEKCKVCNEADDYFVNSTELCQKCRMEGCLDCSSLTSCVSCDQGGDYFLNSSQLCQTCTLPFCADCASLNRCLDCRDVRNVFLNQVSGSCEICQPNNCRRCSSLTTCQVCQNGFYIPAQNSFNGYLTPFHCLQCSIEGCLKCLSRSKCERCDENNKYVFDDFGCSPCSLEGCQKCSSPTQCSVCQEGNGYYLDEGTKTCLTSEPMDSRILIPLVIACILAIILLVGLIGYFYMARRLEKEEAIRQAETAKDMMEKVNNM